MSDTTSPEELNRLATLEWIRKYGSTQLKQQAGLQPPTPSAGAGIWSTPNASAQISNGELLNDVFLILKNPVAFFADPSVYLRVWQMIRAFTPGNIKNGQALWKSFSKALPVLMVMAAITFYFVWYKPSQEAKRARQAVSVVKSSGITQGQAFLKTELTRNAQVAQSLGFSEPVVRAAQTVVQLEEGTTLIGASRPARLNQKDSRLISVSNRSPRQYVPLTHVNADAYLSTLAQEATSRTPLENSAVIHGLHVQEF